MKYAELAELYSKLEATSKRLEKTYLISEFLKNLKYKDNNELEMFLLLIKGNIFSAMVIAIGVLVTHIIKQSKFLLKRSS